LQAVNLTTPARGTSKLAKVLGMTGVPMPYSEVLPALQRNTIDGCKKYRRIFSIS
jgi:TRAP-type C4-dicarboxylate transport system substrate-binding protein